MKRLLLSGLLILSILFSGAQVAEAARTDSKWVDRFGSYLETVWSEGRDILINGSNHYINFNAVTGSSGYGFRDSAGTVQWKNSGGSWQNIGTGGGGSGGGIATGTPWTAGNLVQVVDNGTVESIATSSLNLLTTDIIEGVKLFFTDERAQDAVGGMVNSTLVYTDGTPQLERAGISGDVAVALGSNTSVISDDVIIETDLNVDTTAVDGDLLTYDSTGTNFDWITCAELTGSADLCDGSDASGSGGTGIATSGPIADTEVIYGTGVGTVDSEAAFTYNATTDLLTTTNASTTAFSAVTGFFTNLFAFDASPSANEVLLNVGTGADASRFSVDEDGDVANDGTITSAGSITSSAGNVQGLQIFSNFAGSVTNPNFSFAADTNTGVYKTSSGDANSLSIATNGTQRVVVDSSGNVGIATSSPVARLEAWGTSSGTILNLFTSAGVKVLEVLNTGVATVLGSWDFGGATFLEIPNGTGPTANDPGEIAHDTTDNQLVIDDFVLPTTQKLWGATVASTSVDFVSGGRIPMPPLRDGATITEIHCFVDGGTSVVINVDVLANGSPTDTLTCDADGASDTAQSANTSKTALSLNVVEIGTITGTVDYVSFSVWGTWTRE